MTLFECIRTKIAEIYFRKGRFLILRADKGNFVFVRTKRAGIRLGITTKELKQTRIIQLLFFIVLLWGVPVYTYAQHPSDKINKLKDPELPEGYPKLPAEGADTAEHNRFAREKALWIQKNPEAYRKISERPSLYAPEEELKIRTAKEAEMRVKDTLPSRFIRKP